MTRQIRTYLRLKIIDDRINVPKNRPLSAAISVALCLILLGCSSVDVPSSQRVKSIYVISSHALVKWDFEYSNGKLTKIESGFRPLSPKEEENSKEVDMSLPLSAPSLHHLSLSYSGQQISELLETFPSVGVDKSFPTRGWYNLQRNGDRISYDSVPRQLPQWVDTDSHLVSNLEVLGKNQFPFDHTPSGLELVFDIAPNLKSAEIKTQLYRPAGSQKNDVHRILAQDHDGTIINYFYRGTPVIRLKILWETLPGNTNFSSLDLSTTDGN